MPTVSAVILKKQLKKDNTYNVKIRVGHRTKDAYIETPHYVGPKQLDKNHKIKDQFILDLLFPVLKGYRDTISTMTDLDEITAFQLRDRLVAPPAKKNESEEIDFLAFCNDHIRRMSESGRESSAKTLRRVVNGLCDYFDTPKIAITEINYNFLIKYESFLSKPRKCIRNNHSGHIIEYSLKGVKEAGLHTHMRDLRLLFNAARNHFNDEDLGIMRIMHYPFKKYKIGSAPVTEHRNRDVEELKKIRDAELPEGSRAELARDLFMLSYYMVGMNARDIYELPKDCGDRIIYNRAKTRDKRRDKALISVKVTDQARPLLEKYASKIQERYATSNGLNNAIDIGLQLVSEITGIPSIDFYDARHSVGTLGRNVCGFSTEEIAMALNQKERTVTDIYIAPDWSTVDKVQEAVTSLLV